MNSSFFVKELPIILTVTVLLLTLFLYLLYVRKYRQNQRLIEANRDLIRSINKNINEGLFRSTPAGVFLYVNNAYARMMGYASPEEFMRVPTNSLYVDPQLRKELQYIIAEKGQIENQEVEFYRKDGSTFWVLMNSIGMRGPDGNMEFYDGVVSDITHQKKINEKLRASEQRYRTLLETMSEGLLYVDNNDLLQFANQRLYEMVGYDDEELKRGRLMDILIEPGERQLILDKNKLRMEKIADSYEIQLIHKSGKKVWMKMSGRHVEDAEGKVIGSIATVTDISTLKAAYDELKMSEEKFMAFMNNIPALSWIKDQDARYAFMNQVYMENYNVEGKEAMGKTTEELFPKKFRSPSLAEGDRTVFVEGIKNEVVEQNMTPDGRQHYWLVNRFPIPMFENKRYLGGIAFNVTSLIETRNKLEQSLREKEVLLREIHHRVKNNLQIIISLLNLQSRQIKDKELTRFFSESQSRIRTMALVHEKLYQSNDLAHIDFGEYARGICNHLYKSYITSAGNIRINLQSEKMLVEIEHAVPLGLILTELVSNSLKYAFKDREEGNINISLRFDGDWLIMVTEDDGIGLPEEFSIKDAPSLGLQLVWSLVEQVRGEIEFDTKSGTRFIVVVPKKIPLLHE